ncbi:MAG: molybdenum cofactor guanylyltransferase [Betaproteobacteria bacterium]|nr:molybdenum cofactor guanylyltransferase [Betaproteobacteria bacterium]
MFFVTSAPAPTIRDWPHADMGPLGGIAAALRHARELELEAVLSIGVDAVGLPDDLPHLLSPAPAFLDSQPVIGLWPTTVLAAVERILEGDDKHSMRALAAAIGARAVKLGAEPANINTPADLEAAEKHHGL